MANLFDQFDVNTEGANPFDQFDADTRNPAEQMSAFGKIARIAPHLLPFIPGGSGLGLMHEMGKAADEAGGKVTDLGTKIGLSPEVSAGAGYVTNVGLNAIPVVAGGALSKIASPLFEWGAKSLMQGALKPTIKQLKSGDSATAIDTMLEQGINATKGGVEKIKAKIGELNDQISAAIENSGATINKSEVGKTLMDTLEKFKMQVNPTADMQTIKNAWTDFRNHPSLKGVTDIPVELAQKLKQGTYGQLAKKYGQMGTADVEAQKGLARGLKEGIAEAVPAVRGLNQQESVLIKTLGVAERRALMELNKDLMGLSILAHRPETWAAFMADRSALFKSLVARMLYAGKEQIPATAGRSGIALYEANNQNALANPRSSFNENAFVQ